MVIFVNQSIEIIFTGKVYQNVVDIFTSLLIHIFFFAFICDTNLYFLFRSTLSYPNIILCAVYTCSHSNESFIVHFHVPTSQPEASMHVRSYHRAAHHVLACKKSTSAAGLHLAWINRRACVEWATYKVKDSMHATVDCWSHDAEKERFACDRSGARGSVGRRLARPLKGPPWMTVLLNK
jgi:hypothetical protein